MTNEQIMQWLTTDRLLSPATLREAGVTIIATKYGSKYITFPLRIEDGKPMEMKARIVPGTEKGKSPKFRFFPKKETPVWGTTFVPEGADTVILCEGELDCLLLYQNGHPALTSTTGVQSSKECLPYIPASVQTIILAFDNDEAGKTETKRMADRIHKELPRCRVQCIEWPAEMQGKDVTDFGHYCLVKALNFTDTLMSLCKDIEKRSTSAMDKKEAAEKKSTWTQTPISDPVEPVPHPVELEDVLTLTRQLGFKNDWHIETILATFISKDVDRKRPLWLMIVGAPSSNKTVGIELVSDDHEGSESMSIDVMTPNPFVSGLAQKEEPQDLLPKLDGKCFMVKDYTGIFGRSEETVKQLLSELVAIYDGSFSKHSGSRGTVRYRATFSHIGAITPMGLQRRQQYMNMVGPRFLTLRLAPQTPDQRDEGFEIAWSGNLDDTMRQARRYALHFVRTICNSLRTDGVRLEPETESIKRSLNQLAELISFTRGIVHTSAQQFTDESGNVRQYQETEEVQKRSHTAPYISCVSSAAVSLSSGEKKASPWRK